MVVGHKHMSRQIYQRMYRSQRFAESLLMDKMTSCLSTTLNCQHQQYMYGVRSVVEKRGRGYLSRTTFLFPSLGVGNICHVDGEERQQAHQETFYPGREKLKLRH